MSRILVSAAHKSSGKTTVSIGLAAAFRARGDVQVFKKGPDFIDPLWLGRASGRPAYNLDFNTQTPAEISAFYGRRALANGINIIEGNKGLHDGVDLQGSDSTAALARLLDAPVILVIDVHGMTRGIAPLLMGYKLFDPEVDIAGVVLNQVATSRQEGKLRAAIETYTGLDVLGALPRSPAVIVKERHLGLTTPGDSDGPDARIARIAAVIQENVNLDAICAIAARANHLPAQPSLVHSRSPLIGTVAVARDEAFCFYYEDDLQTLERSGLKIVFFSPLRDETLPQVDGLFLGGGFPETHIAALSANEPMRRSIAAAIDEGMPVHAECGGLMYLTRSIAYQGETGEMVGAIAADAVMHDKPQGRGLVLLEANRPGANPLVPVHEFHHARLENIAPGTRYAWRVRRGQGIDGKHDGIVVNNAEATFSHFRDTSRHHWIMDFTDRIVAARRSPTPSAGAA